MYKVVTENQESLGLRKNPNIMKFFINKWMHEPNPNESKQDSGGIWCCEKLSAARGLKKYFEKKYGKAKIFECETGIVLFQNNYRIKTDKVKLIKEIIY
jgi:hypothetical protein